MKIPKLFFGTAGTPVNLKERSSLAGIKKVRELGLDCMELEFVRGIRMSKELAIQVKEAAQKNNIILTAHAPYYINLNSKEPEKTVASVKRIIDTATITNIAGGYSFTFHAAFFMGQDPKKVYEKVKNQIKNISKTLQDNGINLWIRPETTGKATQFGSLIETIKLSQDIEQVLPCIDFAHLHARHGKQNSKQEFDNILSTVEKEIGREALDNMHIHMSGIHYSDKGERKHLILEESDINYRELMQSFKEFKIKGVVICESPNIEDDALLMQKYYDSTNPDEFKR